MKGSLEYKVGDVLAEEAEALVNTVNCVGVMGRGIALQFKKAFPDNFKAYARACEREEVHPGQMFVYETGRLTNPRYIINFPTKRHWRGNSRMEDIESGLVALVHEIETRNIRSIAIPPLGSGLGGLNWADVRPRIEKVLRGLNDLQIVVFEPDDAAASASRRVWHKKAPGMTAARAALVSLMHHYLRDLLDPDPFVTLLEVHKLMYFMQLAGEPLKLRYQKAPLGPYADNLRHLLHRVEGHFVYGYADGGDEPNKQLKLVPGAIQDASEYLARHTDTQSRCTRVAELIDGFESPFGLELLATVHWIAASKEVKTVEDIVAQTYAWSERKKRFSRRQIELAVHVLSQEDWTGVSKVTNGDRH